MRVAGAAILTAAGLLAGLAAVDDLRRRRTLREGLARMLTLLGFELERFRTPLPALFGKLPEQLEGEAAAFCRRVRDGLAQLGSREMEDIWREAVAPLPAEERRILTPLGQVLGRYGAEEQLAAVDACRGEMERARDETAAALRERSRMYIGVGAAGAAVLAVLLM